jgi:hypothetical protein
MCGLVCVVSKYSNGFTDKQKEVFNTLLFIDTLRGDDSTGAFLVENTGDVMLAKEIGAAQSFMKTKEYREITSRAYTKGSALVGHNRKATRGTISDANAHPFHVEDKVVLVHNGTLIGDHKKHADVEVDSHALAHLVARHSPEEAFSKIHGAYACIWYNFEDKTLNFFRNKERPLYWAETAHEWIWASEDTFINFAADRHDLKLLGKPAMLPEHCLNIFSLDKSTWDVDSKNLSIKPPAFPVHTSTYGGYRHDYSSGKLNPWTGEYDWVASAPPTKIPPEKKEEEPHTVVPVSIYLNEATEFEKDHAIKNDALVTLQEFTLMTNSFGFNSTVVCCANTYDKCNENTFDVYYTPISDTDALVKQRISNTTEDSVLDLCTSNNTFRITLGTRRWSLIQGQQNKEGASRGVAMFQAASITRMKDTVAYDC